MSALSNSGGGPSGMANPCNHGVTFPPDDEYAAVTQDMTVSEIRARWPRLFGVCPLGCGYNGIYYASYIHYLCGDW